jgi:N-acetylglucosaminyldiphosphoundecaprenol N-acetyl-beta-D-mannosaminyltransferase
MPFNFVVSLLSILERREYTAYLLGSKIKILKKTEKNIRQTFPQLRIVGRFVGSFRKQEEPGILEAIRKAAPHLVLVGKGIRGGELWIGRNHVRLSRGLRIWCSDLFDVFAERKKHPSQEAFDSGLEALGYCLRNPFKFLRLFPYFRYKFLLVIYKIFRKN